MTSGLQSNNISSVATQKEGSENNMVKIIVDHLSKDEPGREADFNPAGTLMRYASNTEINVKKTDHLIRGNNIEEIFS